MMVGLSRDFGWSGGLFGLVSKWSLGKEWLRLSFRVIELVWGLCGWSDGSSCDCVLVLLFLEFLFVEMGGFVLFIVCVVVRLFLRMFDCDWLISVVVGWFFGVFGCFWVWVELVVSDCGIISGIWGWWRSRKVWWLVMSNLVFYSCFTLLFCLKMFSLVLKVWCVVMCLFWLFCIDIFA